MPGSLWLNYHLGSDSASEGDYFEEKADAEKQFHTESRLSTPLWVTTNIVMLRSRSTFY